ncbi:MAG: class I SAM-dependent methyltransferase [Desulfosudis oleivorans]|nr:class I SAM-dependent methyltransferase [Desulfosudis oleivorans]
MNIDFIKQFQEKPAPFTPGEPLFWDDPHISAQMLKAHLDPDNDLASRRPQTIQKSVDWITASLDLQAGDSVLDLGCGPGLYAARLAERGLRVAGIDYSRCSIDHATQDARKNNLEINYRYQDYLALEDEDCYAAALLIYGDYCPLASEQRKKLLANIHRALKPNGYFVLDVTTPTHRKRHGSRNGWYAVETGFWKPGPHLVLEEGFDYPDQSIFLDQAIIIEENGKVSVYRNWFQDFTRETITAELEAGGFAVQSVWNDLIGTPFTEDTEWLGIIAQNALHQ